MKIVYYTTGTSGSGRVVQGIALGNALRRRGVRVELTILSSSPFAHLADLFGIPHREIPPETSDRLTAKTYPGSRLYRELESLDADVLVVDQFWMALHHFLTRLPCRKVFFCRQIADSFFSISVPSGRLTFRPEDYDIVLASEPFESSIPRQQINPVVIRNHEEILPRAKALAALNLVEGEKACLFAYNGNPGEYERITKLYSYLADEGYQMVYSSNYQGGLFPAADYYNAFDLLISGAGYNSFWEAIYFQKEAVFIPVPTRFEDQRLRVDNLQEYHFQENGADQLVELILSL